MIPERLQNSIKGLIQMINYIQDNHGNTKDMTIIEIGAWTGRASIVFANSFKYVICVDPWEATTGISTEYDMKEVWEIFRARKEKHDNMIAVKRTSNKFFTNRLMAINKEDYTNGYDVIYIDGAHDYENVKHDIEHAKKHCKILCGHDYWPGRFPEVIKAVDKTVGKPDKIFPDTSWIKELKC